MTKCGGESLKMAVAQKQHKTHEEKVAGLPAGHKLRSD